MQKKESNSITILLMPTISSVLIF